MSCHLNVKDKVGEELDFEKEEDKNDILKTKFQGSLRSVLHLVASSISVETKEENKILTERNDA